MKTFPQIVGSVILGLTSFASVVPFAHSSDELTFANYRDIRDVNPHLYAGEMIAQDMIYEGLFKLDENGNVHPSLATDWSVSDDGKVYTFKLRQGVTFSDGSEFNAHVAKQNFDALLDNSSRHTWLESIRLMVEVKKLGKEPVVALDDDTLQISFTDSYYPFIIELGVTRPFRMLSPNCFINGTTKEGVSCHIGTGSYVLSEHVVDQVSTFTRNESYWGEEPQVDKVTIKVIPDDQARLLALQNGDIDMIHGLQMIKPRAYHQFANKSGYHAKMSKPVSTRMMIVNTTRKNLEDVNVRRALNHLVNRKAISEKIMLGLEAPAGTMLSPSIPYADVGLKPYEYDKSIADKLFAEAGYELKGKQLVKDGEPLTIEISYGSNAVMEKTIAQYLQSEWGKSGVTVKLLAEERQAHMDRMKQGDFDISFNISWGRPYDPQSFLGGMRKAVYGDYIAQQGLTQKPKIDESILSALQSVDEKARQDHYRYVLETLHNESVYIPISFERNRVLFSDKVAEVGFSASPWEVPVRGIRVN